MTSAGQLARFPPMSLPQWHAAMRLQYLDSYATTVLTVPRQLCDRQRDQRHIGLRNYPRRPCTEALCCSTMQYEAHG
jgi:hypothetical protein